MTDIVLVAIVAALPPTLASVTAVVLGIINRTKLEQVVVKQEDNAKAMDGHLATIVDLTKKVALATGIEIGKKQEKDKAEEVRVPR